MVITDLTLPTLPTDAALVTAEAAEYIEGEIAVRIQDVDDMAQAEEWLARADALAAYLRHSDAEGPMLGSMRRMEARIGELLGDAPGRGRREMNEHVHLFDPRIRADFRALAALVAAGHLDYTETGPDSRWRASRRALLLYSTVQNMGGLKSSVTVEWYTPADYIEAARMVMGGIDLDPASSPLANETVGAAEIFDVDMDGLLQEWHGRVWLNPPYGSGTGQFVTKLVEQFNAGNVSAAVLLINAYGFDSSWFQPLWNYPLCFTDHRIEFWSPSRGSGGPANANLFVYLGDDEQAFIEQFSPFGRIVKAIA